MIIFITGNRSTGKTTKALEIIGDSSYVQLEEHSLCSEFAFQHITKDTQYILIDEVVKKENIKRLVYAEVLVIDKPMEYFKLLKKPNLIIVSQKIKPKDFKYLDAKKVTHIKM